MARRPTSDAAQAGVHRLARGRPVWAGPMESVALLTVLPAPAAARTSTIGALRWAPLVGLVLGGLAAGAGMLVAGWVSAPAGAVAAVCVLAVLSRGLHLDGLADTADGLGSGRDPERAAQVMHRGDVGPFGVATLVLTLLAQVAALQVLLTSSAGWLALPVAAVAARLAMARGGLPGVPVAVGSSLGRAVAGTVPVPWMAGATVVSTGLLVGAAVLVADLGTAARLLGAAVGGLLAAELLHRRATARLGGTSGDVMGAVGEAALTVTLLVAAALWH